MIDDEQKYIVRTCIIIRIIKKATPAKDGLFYLVVIQAGIRLDAIIARQSLIANWIEGRTRTCDPSINRRPL